jgi:Family of unknown function (DUF6166)
MIRCIRCNKQLTDPKSIARLMGAVCVKKAMAEAEKAKEDNQLPLLLFEGDIVCKRTKAGAQFNIPQSLIYHSPTGMEWGYGGSGAADYALNILALYTDRKTAFKHYQNFKWQFIATMEAKGGKVTGQVIRAWLEDRVGTHEV